jgi:enoyl-CoA hydratase
MIRHEETDGIAVITLAHGKVNALDLEFCRAIAQTFRELAVSGPRAAVLTGQGSSFSAGVDLRRLVDGGPDYVAEFIPALTDAFTAVFTYPRPLVTAVNGHAIAGGCVLATSGDHRVMARANGGIGVPELLVGVPFPSVALAIIQATAGAAESRRAVLSGEIYPPGTAVSRGFIDELTEPEQLISRSLQHAARLAETIPPQTFALTKRRLRAAATGPDAAYDAEVTRIWQEKAADGWIGQYLARVTGQSAGSR